MGTWELGEVFLTRDFEAHGGDGQVSSVKLLLGKPYLDEQRTVETEIVWCCPFCITGIGFDRVLPAFGEDMLASILNALHGAGQFFESYVEPKGIRVTWMGETDLGLKGYQPEIGSDKNAFDAYSGVEAIFNKFFEDFTRENPPKNKP